MKYLKFLICGVALVALFMITPIAKAENIASQETVENYKKELLKSNSFTIKQDLNSREKKFIVFINGKQIGTVEKAYLPKIKYVWVLRNNNRELISSFDRTDYFSNINSYNIYDNKNKVTNKIDFNKKLRIFENKTKIGTFYAEKDYMELQKNSKTIEWTIVRTTKTFTPYEGTTTITKQKQSKINPLVALWSGIIIDSKHNDFAKKEEVESYVPADFYAPPTAPF